MTSAIGETAPSLEFADVPAADPTAEVDPHWLKLRADSLLPMFYMPPTMSGSHSKPMRFIAAIVISVFMLATSLGVCLTYGGPS
jgi:hypothetical protein